ncbi:MAG: FGGY-family carbohydrate kinase [Candidatus Hadarchaeales archaeon]
MGYILAHDLGTELNKAALVDEEGRIAAYCTQEYSVSYPRPGWAEQDPELWWRAVRETTRKVLGLARVKPEEVEALVFDSMMYTLVAVDREGRPLRPAILWLDTRAKVQAEELMGSLDLLGMLDRGVIPPTSAKDITPKILWVKQEEPEVFERARFIDSKDYLVHRCVGDFYTDWSCASLFCLFNFREKKWEEELVEEMGLSLDRLSKPVKSTEVVGNLTEEASRELGLPRKVEVVCGSGDATAVAVGAGGPHLYIGTSAWIGAHVEEPLFDLTGVGSICAADPSKFFLIGEMENAGACLKWFRETLAREERERAEREGKGPYQLLDELAAGVEAGSGKLLFLPWMMGERCPFTQSTARGAFLNLTFGHTKGHLVRAVLEGVAYHMRWILEVVEGMGLSLPSLRACGGGAKSEVWLQIFADVMGKKVERVSSPHHVGSLGAATIARVGLGKTDFPSAERSVRVEGEFLPSEKDREIYDRMYGEFKGMQGRLSEVFERLNT